MSNGATLQVLIPVTVKMLKTCTVIKIIEIFHFLDSLTAECRMWTGSII